MAKFVDLSFGKNDLNFDFSLFQELKPSEQVVGPFKVWELSKRGWNYEYHWKRPTADLKPVGVYNVNDLIVTRPAGMIVNRLLGYGCNTGQVAVGSIPVEENLFYMSPKNKIIINEKVIVADGVAFHVFGHWLVDYLPRFGVARDILQDQFQQVKILLPVSTPGWVFNLLNITCNVSPANIIKYNPDQDIVLCKQAILPSYCYTNEFSFHSYFKEFYQLIGEAYKREKPTRKILISRSSHLDSNRQLLRRDFFEQEAMKRGYELIAPENFSIPEQIKMFSEAKAVIGEHGSGMHNTIFSQENTVVGCIGFWNAVQLHIGYIMGHQNVYLTNGCDWPSAESNMFKMDCSEDDIISFLEKIETLLPKED